MEGSASPGEQHTDTAGRAQEAATQASHTLPAVSVCCSPGDPMPSICPHTFAVPLGTKSYFDTKKNLF